METTTQIPTETTEKKEKEELKYSIQKHLGVLSTAKSGWTREVNIVSWNERPNKLDIRDWNQEHRKMSKGITLNGAEVAFLNNILAELNIEDAGI